MRAVHADLIAKIPINRVKAGTTIGKGARDVLAAGQDVTTYASKDKAAKEIQSLLKELKVK